MIEINYYERGIDEEFDKECEQRTITTKTITYNLLVLYNVIRVIYIYKRLTIGDN